MGCVDRNGGVLRGVRGVREVRTDASGLLLGGGRCGSERTIQGC